MGTFAGGRADRPRSGKMGADSALPVLGVTSAARYGASVALFFATRPPPAGCNIEHPTMSYLSEKLASARSALMLPHVKGEINSITAAMIEASLGLDGINRSTLEPSLQDYVRQLDDLMDTTGLSDPNGEGLYAVKARSFTVDQQAQFSHVIDQIASLSNS